MRRITAGKKCYPCWGTYGSSSISIHEFYALRRQFIEMGCLIIFAAITTQIGVTQVIGHDVNDIGPGGLALHHNCIAKNKKK